MDYKNNTTSHLNRLQRPLLLLNSQLQCLLSKYLFHSLMRLVSIFFSYFIPKLKWTLAIEDVLETAIFKAGGITVWNYGDLSKIGWSRFFYYLHVSTSKLFKEAAEQIKEYEFCLFMFREWIQEQVHALHCVITFKMELNPEDWNTDPYGFAACNRINSFLPPDIRTFACLRVFTCDSFVVLMDILLIRCQETMVQRHLVVIELMNICCHTLSSKTTTTIWMTLEVFWRCMKVSHMKDIFHL